MSKIIITGTNGQVGSELMKIAGLYPHLEIIGTDRHTLPLEDRDQIQQFIQAHQPRIFINCAAYTAVDLAETEHEKAALINDKAVGWIAEACQQTGTRLIHLSTDYVYHNDHHNKPYKETDAVSPQGVYASTKLAGEEKIRAILDDAVIIRTSWVYSTFGNNFVKTMLRLGKEREKLNVIFDQIGTPTCAADLAKALLHIVEKIESATDKTYAGTYHYSNEGVCSWYDFATAIMEIAGLSCSVSPIETKDFPTPAKRPAFSLMNKEKIRRQFDLSIPYWRESLVSTIEALKAGSL